MGKQLRKILSMLLVGTMFLTNISVEGKALDYVGHWAEKELGEWIERGILSGYEDGSLKPDMTVTRAEFATMLVRVFGLSHVDETLDYGDIVEDIWYESYVMRVLSAGMMNVDDEKFRPNDPITREEAAYAVATAYHIQKNDENIFVDEDQVVSWAKEQVNALAVAGYISGYGDGTFRPQGNLTRAEAIMMLDKVTAEIIHIAGIYTQDIVGNLVVNTTDVILKDMTIHGNLYLAEGIGEGDVVLNNVEVFGKTVVEGGGENSIKLIGTRLEDILVDKAEGKVRVAADKASAMGSVQVKSAVQLEGMIEKVHVATVEEIKLVAATVEEVQIFETGAKVELDKETTLQTLIADAQVVISGEGKIEQAEINVDDVVIKGVQIHKDKITINEEVKEPPAVEKPSIGGNNSSSGSSDDSSDSSGGTVTPIQKTSIRFNVSSQEGFIEDAVAIIYVESPGIETWSERGVTDANGQVFLSSGRTFPVGTKISYIVEKMGYEPYEGTYITTSEGMNSISVQLSIQDTSPPAVVSKAAVTPNTLHTPEGVYHEFMIILPEGATFKSGAKIGYLETTSENAEIYTQIPELIDNKTLKVKASVNAMGEEAEFNFVIDTRNIVENVKNIETDTISVTLDTEIVDKMTISPQSMEIKEWEYTEFKIQFPEGYTLKPELPLNQKVEVVGNNVYTTLVGTKRVDAKTMTVNVSAGRIEENASFHLVIPATYFEEELSEVVTQEIPVSLIVEAPIEGAVVTPDRIQLRKGDEQEFKITLPKEYNFIEIFSNYSLIRTINEEGVVVGVSFPKRLDEQTAIVDTSVWEVTGKNGSMQFILPQELIANSSKDIITNTVHIDILPSYDGSIVGEVRLGSQPATGAEVTLYKMTSETESNSVATTYVSKIGLYEFKNVEPGFYRIEVTYEIEGVLHGARVSAFEVTDQFISKDIRLDKVEDTVLTFKVTDEKGPLEGVEIFAEANVPEVSDWSNYSKTNANGEATFNVGHPFQQWTTINYTVIKEGYETCSESIQMPNEGHVYIEVPPMKKMR